MCAIAPTMKRNRNTEVIGTSRLVVGVPPKPAVVGGYGAESFVLRLVVEVGLKVEVELNPEIVEPVTFVTLGTTVLLA